MFHNNWYTSESIFIQDNGIMKTLFFTVQNRRSLLTTRLVYGLEGMKYIIQIYEGEINGHGEKERLPEEFQYEFEQ